MKDLRLFHNATSEDALYYVMDPMCSWCWAFAPALQSVVDDDRLNQPLVYVMGGLAADTDDPMSPAMQQQIARIWQHIEALTGARFNHAFWQQNNPRRATFAACRAVIAAEALAAGAFAAMIDAIQRGYYLRALNPSETSVLVQLAEETGLPSAPFADLLASEAVTIRLTEHLRWRDRLLVQGYPALVYWHEQQAIPVISGYCARAELEQALRRRGLLRE
ncbi:DsbA family protein [Motiliproteus sediminis]|uniref:DsbA family protein n=1 Tax=Motiliproteus sediminis TaxID=1468178 RepID=UPI001AEFF7F6|nr:DsbA family protein [Motiliproteus sediminis]